MLLLTTTEEKRRSKFDCLARFYGDLIFVRNKKLIGYQAQSFCARYI